MRSRFHRIRNGLMLVAGVAALAATGAAETPAAQFHRAFAQQIPSGMVAQRKPFAPKNQYLPRRNSTVNNPGGKPVLGNNGVTPNAPTGPNPNVVTPGRYPNYPNGPYGPRRPRPGVGVAIGTGIIVGTGVAVGTIGPAGAVPPPGMIGPPGAPPPPGALPPGARPPGARPPGGPQGPQGPSNRINIPPANENRFVKNEVVLEFNGNFSPAAVSQLLARHRLVQVERQSFALTNTTYLLVRIPDQRQVRNVLRALTNEATVNTGQPNYLYVTGQSTSLDRLPQLTPPSAAAPKPDPNKANKSQQQDIIGNTLPQLRPSNGFVIQGGDTPQMPVATPAAVVAGTLPAKGDPAQYAVAKLRLTEAHSMTLGNNVLVAVIDSGIDLSHPELTGVIAGNFDALGTAEQPHRHGTAVAGAIAAHSRLLGVAPAARILSIRAFGATKTSAEATTFAILKGVEQAIAQNARVINMSFAGPFDPGLGRHLAAAHAKGAVLIAAAGNFGAKSPPQYPAADAHVIAVTATDADDKLFAAANRGAHVALAAPGVDILLPAPEAGYWMASGTSFAAAQVSGIAALILSRQPALAPDEVRAILMMTAKDLGDPGRDALYGAGLADAYKALVAVGLTRPEASVTAPLPVAAERR